MGEVFPDFLTTLHGANELPPSFLLPSLCVLPVSLPSRGPGRPVRNEGGERTQRAFGLLVGPDYVAQADLEFLPPSGVLELLVPGKQRDSGHEGQKFICGQSRNNLDNSQNQRRGCHKGAYHKCRAASPLRPPTKTYFQRFLGDSGARISQKILHFKNKIMLTV